MAIRTTTGAVEGIIEVDTTISLTPFIEVASSLVDEICVPLGYADARLELIERWLSAHFYAIRDPRAKMEQAGSVSESFFGKVDLRLDVTRYGQQAITLCTKGGLDRLNRGSFAKPGAFWLGTDLSPTST